MQSLSIDTDPAAKARATLYPRSALGNPADHASEGSLQGKREMPQFGMKGERASIAFNTGEFVPPAGERVQPLLAQHALAANAAAKIGADASVYGLILLDGHIDAKIQANLEALGVKLYGFYPNAAYRARIPVSSLADVAQLPHVKWVGQPGISQKMAPQVRALAARSTYQATASAKVYVSFFGKDEDGLGRRMLRAAGAQLGYYDERLGIQLVDVPAGSLTQVAGLNPVLYVSPMYEGQTGNYFGMSTINADELWGYWDPADNNAAHPIKVGIPDSGFYPYHQDFSNVFSGVWGYSLVSGENVYTDLNHHGTHVAGTILGEGKADARYRGVAAGLTSHSDPANNPDLLVVQVFNSAGKGAASLLQAFDLLDGWNGGTYTPGQKRDVINFSGWGYGSSGSDPESQKVDSLFADNVLLCIIAGNGGPGASTVSTPGTAKGALTVGSVYNNTQSGFTTDNIASYSSRGPSANGLYKPDVVAPGSKVDSTLAGTSNGYTYDWDGTSMAAPHVTGVAAALKAWLNAPAWALKTIIMANCVDLGFSRNDQGLGKIDALSTIYNIDGGWQTWWASNGSTGDVQYRDIYLPNAAAQLRLVMTYPDPPAASGTTSILVNDVDMYVQYAASQASLTTDRTANWSDTGVDPVSVVKINNAPAGWYRIKMYSYRVPSTQAWGVTAKWVYSTVSPNVNLTLNVPYAVRPNSTFYADAKATSTNYVASGVVASVVPDASFALDGTWYSRRGKPASSQEWSWLPNPFPGGMGFYDPSTLNMGNIAQWHTRELEWALHGTSEGAKNVTFQVNSRNGGFRQTSATVIVDGTSPVITGIQGRHWTSALHCDVVGTPRDTLAGLDPSAAYYRYSTDGGSTYSAWFNTACTGGYGTTAAQTITCSDVPFNQNNSNNVIQLYIVDTAGNVQTATATITAPTVTAISASPNPIPGSVTATGTVKLSAAAPTDGAQVLLSDTNPSAVLPGSVLVPGGATSATFPITTSVVTSKVSGTMTARYGGATVNGSLSVRPISVASVALSPNNLVGGYNSTGTVTLEAPAAPGSITVTLASSNTGAATVPASITIAGGSTTGTFTATTHVVSANTSASIKATANGSSKSASLTVRPDYVTKVTLSPTTVVGGTANSTATVTLAAVAPVNTTVTLTSSNTAAATVPASFVITAGHNTGTFTVTSLPVASSTSSSIKATAGGASSSATLSVKPDSLASLTLSPTSVKGGSANSTATVTLIAPAPAGGVTVTLSSSNTGAATVPASIVVTSGHTTATFTVTSHVVAAKTSSSIKATAGGVSKTATLTVTP